MFVFCGLSCPWLLMSYPVHGFLRIYPVLLFCLIDLFFRVMTAFFSCISICLDLILKAPTKGYKSLVFGITTWFKSLLKLKLKVCTLITSWFSVFLKSTVMVYRTHYWLHCSNTYEPDCVYIFLNFELLLELIVRKK